MGKKPGVDRRFRHETESPIVEWDDGLRDRKVSRPILVGPAGGGGAAMKRGDKAYRFTAAAGVRGLVWPWGWCSGSLLDSHNSFVNLHILTKR